MGFKIEWFLVLTLACTLVSYTAATNLYMQSLNGTPGHPNGTEPEEEPLKLVNIKWQYVLQPMVMVTFLIFVGLIMVGYHHTGKFADYFPETCLLLLIGIGFGALFWATGSLREINFGEREFMLFLLPPIVLDASYQLNNKAFTSNIWTVLWYAVVGTVINFFFIGGCLYGLSQAGLTKNDYSTIDAFLFASFIIAVDPVAVIAIFKAAGVNDQLYYLVFGESLFNDAVTIVVFELMRSFTFQDSMSGKDVGLAVVAFFVHSLGAAFIGFVIGVLSGVLTKFTKHMRIVEPTMVYILAYWAYLLNELLGWSGIIGLAVCCLTQTQLAFQNLSRDSMITLTTGASVLGVIVEATVFLFLGIEIFVIASGPESADWMLILWVLILCLFGRFMTVFGLNAAANPLRESKIPLKEQFIMFWAGLRGALAFALACTLHHEYQYRYQYITATIAYIIFTIFIMGTTMQPLVKALKIKMKADEPSEIPVEQIDMGSSMEIAIDSKNTSLSRKPSKIMSVISGAGLALKRNLSQPSGLVEPMPSPKEGQINLAYTIDEEEAPNPDYDMETTADDTEIRFVANGGPGSVIGDGVPAPTECKAGDTEVSHAVGGTLTRQGSLISTQQLLPKIE